MGKTADALRQRRARLFQQGLRGGPCKAGVVRGQGAEREEMPVCGLCQRHQKLETVDGTAFWLEYGEDGRPRLVMDSTARGGGLNVLCAEFCPMCGRFCGKLEAEHEEK